MYFGKFTKDHFCICCHSHVVFSACTECWLRMQLCFTKSGKLPMKSWTISVMNWIRYSMSKRVLLIFFLFLFSFLSISSVSLLHNYFFFFFSSIHFHFNLYSVHHHILSLSHILMFTHTPCPHPPQQCPRAGLSAVGDIVAALAALRLLLETLRAVDGKGDGIGMERCGHWSWSLWLVGWLFVWVIDWLIGYLFVCLFVRSFVRSFEWLIEHKKWRTCKWDL